jgi:hypothetical protein
VCSLPQDLLGDLTINGCSFGNLIMILCLAAIAMSCECSLEETSDYFIPVSAHMSDFAGPSKDP